MYRSEELNEIQKMAVNDTASRAVLVTAGAGSGKTRLLTHRIVHLIKDDHVSPYNILAITFTNKAANEMRVRLGDMLGNIEGMWIFTFHAACVRILRRYIDLLGGFTRDFTIYGEQETRSVIKRILKDLDLEEDMLKRATNAVSDAKNKGIAPEDYCAVYKFSQDSETLGRIYMRYQLALQSNNALDYDDLLIKTHYLLQKFSEPLEYYRQKFRFIHIDEFQDTNKIQYEIAKLLAGETGNIFVVGDEDQCIYTWRGADITNIADFRRDFNCKIYKLEQNYRSTSNILDLANRLIKGNTQRLEKRLWTQNGSGAKVELYAAENDGFEADRVVRQIFELVNDGEYNYSDCAVLMRLNALSRPFEERFLRYGIPHVVYGGFKFYDRKEIRDVLAYARVSVNPYDDEAIYRIINFPRRGIGEASVERIRAVAADRCKSAFEVITNPDAFDLPNALKSKLFAFGNTLKNLRAAAAEGNVTSYFNRLLLTELNIYNIFSSDADDRIRLENINELINSVKEFVENNGDVSLSEYLQTVSLYSDTDDEDDRNAVTLATVHSAKGLEFPVVFIVGLEEGIFPSIRVNENESDHMEEERRLMYVAITRAKRRLFLSYARSRFIYGSTKSNIVSRFLVECGLAERKSSKYDVFTNDPSGKSSYAAERRAPFSPSQPSGSPFSGAYKSDFGKPEPAKKSGAVGNIRVGCTVMHKRLGKGVVISMENNPGGSFAKIEFEKAGVLLLAIDFAPLTVVEE